MAQPDIYEQVTAQIVTLLEAGTKPWQRDWFKQEQLRANGQPYRGINCLLLAMSTGLHGFEAPHWMTFKQARDLGGMVRKGERGTRIVFFSTIEKRDAEGEDPKATYRLLKGYTVFNVEQIDGLPAGKFERPALSLIGDKARDTIAEEALRSCGADIRHGGEQAFYCPSSDHVQMPHFERFYSTGGYLATLAHELTHWTGGKARLDRDMQGQFGGKRYAFEELIAEMGAAFIGARLGFNGDHIDNHAAYLASWLKALQEDKRAIFRAASAAQTAADLVLANAGNAKPAEAEAPAPAPAQAEPRQALLAF